MSTFGSVSASTSRSGSPPSGSSIIAVELPHQLAGEISGHPDQVRVGDCQERLEFPDNHVDRALALHVLEHLPNLPAAVRELHRVCSKQHGRLRIVIPTEGGLAYGIARRISAQRFSERLD
jgi:SAM-dependent methyltransferase